MRIEKRKERRKEGRKKKKKKKENQLEKIRESNKEEKYQRRESEREREKWTRRRKNKSKVTLGEQSGFLVIRFNMKEVEWDLGVGKLGLCDIVKIGSFD